MHRRQFLQTSVASSALLALPATAALLAPAPARFALGYHSGRAGDVWRPALARAAAANAPRLRIALDGVRLAQTGAALQRLHVDLLYRAPGAPLAFSYATVRRAGTLAVSQPVKLELDADRLAGFQVDYVWRDAAGTDHPGSETLAWTDTFNPLLTPGTYALVGARATGTPPGWHVLAAPARGCALGRCDGGAIDFDALMIGVEAV
jgi:hypothetical protein